MGQEVGHDNGTELYFLCPLSYSLFHVSKSDRRRLENTSISNRMEYLPTVPEQQCNTFRRKVFSPTSSRGL
jgi:hypothetical protein